MLKLLITISIIAAVTLTGCSRGLFSVHKIDIQQGNALEPSDIEAVQPGMSRKKVQHLLGLPVLTPIFTTDRWDYVYYLKEPDVPVVSHRLSVYFAGDQVVKVVR